jgi:tryptophan synthase alpha chain
MSLISSTFQQLKEENRKALIPYFTAGFPDVKTFADLVVQTDTSDTADLIEIGIPFSDPLADGPSIQFSSQKALENKITLEKSLNLLSDIATKIKIPLVIMSYLNPLLQYSLEKFFKNAAEIGITGLIIPDLVIEEGIEIEPKSKKHSLDLIYLLAPTTNGQRRKEIVKRSRGFVYLVSIAGVTGSRNNLPSYLKDYIQQVKSLTSKPVCVGFGVFNPKQAGQVAQSADGVIVGSAIVEIIRKEKNYKAISRGVGNFLQSLRKGMDTNG